MSNFNGRKNITIAETFTMMKTQCRHSRYSYYGNNYSINCVNVCSAVDNLLDRNVELPIDFLNKFLRYVCYGSMSSNYSYYGCCVKSESSNLIKDIIGRLILVCKITADDLNMIIKFNMDEYLQTLKDMKTVFRFNEISKIKIENNESIKLVIDMLVEDSYENMFNSYSNNEEIMLYFIDEKGYVPTKSNLEHICGNLTMEFKTNFFKKFSDFGIYPDSSCLEKACYKCPPKLIKEILDMRIPPNCKSFDAAVSNRNNRNEIIELLIYYGYSPTYENILNASKNGVEIQDIHRFEIELDKEILRACLKSSYGFYPKSYKIKNVSEQMKELHLKLNSNSSLTIIKKIITTYNLVPDDIAMEIACDHRNSNVCQYLIDAGGPITPLCVRNVVANLSRSSFALILIDGLEKTFNKMKQELNNSKSTESLKREVGLIECSDSDQDIFNEDEENEPVKVPVKESKDKMILSEIKNKINLLDSKEEPKVIIKENNPNVAVVVVPDTIKLPNSKRKKMNVPSKLVKIFALDKSTKMSFMDARKFLTTKIQENKWLDPNDKNLINFPSQIRKELGIPIKGYVRIADLDKVLSLCYN